MHYVYLILEDTTRKRYIGRTDDLKKRMKYHNSGRGGRTTSPGKWHLVYYEAYLHKKDATAREYRLKHDGRSRRFLYQRAENSLAGLK